MKFNPKLPTSRTVQAAIALILACFGGGLLFIAHRNWAWVILIIAASLFLRVLLPESATTIIRKSKRRSITSPQAHSSLRVNWDSARGAGGNVAGLPPWIFLKRRN